MEACPFCKAEQITDAGSPWAFQCRTSISGFTGTTCYLRSFICYEAQLAAQAELLRECREVVRGVQACVDTGAGSDKNFFYIALKREIVTFATALLIRIDAAVGKEG